MHTLIPREVIGVAYCHAPRQTSDPRDITYDELQRAHQSGSLVGLSVLDNHDQSRRAGSVTKSRFDDESGTLTLHMHMFDTDCGRDALVKLQSKQYRGLSLAHHLHSRRIDEVSVCKSHLLYYVQFACKTRAPKTRTARSSHKPHTFATTASSSYQQATSGHAEAPSSFRPVTLDQE